MAGLQRYFQTLSLKKSEFQRRRSYRIHLMRDSAHRDPAEPYSLKSWLLSMLEHPDDSLAQAFTTMSVEPAQLHDHLLAWTEPQSPTTDARKLYGQYVEATYAAAIRCPLRKMPAAGPAGAHMLLALVESALPLSGWLRENGIDAAQIRQTILSA